MSEPNVIMGRADVLLRFLQLIGKDRPGDLDEYMDPFDADTQRRPLVNQIVDRIVAGDSELYERFAQARREVGARNPYASPDERRESGYETAVGNFVSRWVEVERIVRRRAEESMEPGQQMYAWWRLGASTFPEDLAGELQYLRRLRNEVVHGRKNLSVNQLNEASQILESLLKQL